MNREEKCVCGHPQSAHRTYGCTASIPSPDPKKTNRIYCKCKTFQAEKAAGAR